MVAALCASVAQASTPLAPFGVADDAGVPVPPWIVEALPGQRLAVTAFRVVQLDGRLALRIEANASYGNLVHRLKRAPATGWLSWQWRIDELNRAVDLRSKQADDTSAKVCVMFDMAIDRVPFIERQILRLARSRTGIELPAATVCYVWDAALAAGTRIDNAYSRRVRYLILRSGSAPTHQWMSERRDVAADFLSLFGDESAAEVPSIQAIAIGGDADNTGGKSLAFVADLRFVP